MSFVRSGYVYSGFGSLRLMGSDGYLWTLSVLAGALQTSYESAFDVTGVYPTSYRDWVYGLADCNDFYMFSYISFVRSGYVNIPPGSIRRAGRGTDYYTSSAYPGSSTNAYNLSYNTILAGYHDDQKFGFLGLVEKNQELERYAQQGMPEQENRERMPRWMSLETGTKTNSSQYCPHSVASQYYNVHTHYVQKM